MIVGYARTSTVDQVAGYEAQLRELQAIGAEKIFSEQVSSVQQREQLDLALDFVREGDTLVVTKLDRLARSVAHLIAITQRLEGKKVTLRILNLNLDTSTSTGRLMLHMLGSIGQFERELMLERQREGIAKAKADGKYKGRPATIDNEKIRQLVAGGMPKARVARELGVSRESVYRALGEV